MNISKEKITQKNTMKLFLIPLISFLYIAISNAENKECPIMVGDEIDEEEVAEFEGKKV